jgi:MoxR-like ATPase
LKLKNKSINEAIIIVKEIKQKMLPATISNIGTPLQQQLAAIGHFVSTSTATQLEMAWQQRLPVLLEGLPGAGKTALAKKFAEAKGAKLYRLQCYEAINFQGVLYYWDQTLQRLCIEEARQQRRQAQLPSLTGSELRAISYAQECLIAGVLMQVLADPQGVLIIDELDKASNEFANGLLEFLGEFQITINETNETIKPPHHPPFVIITSNAGAGNSEREKLEDPILRRCVYINIPLPTIKEQFHILKFAAPSVSEHLIIDCLNFLKYLEMRRILEKPCSLAEGRAWLQTLALSQVSTLCAEVVATTAGMLAKTPSDVERLITNTKPALSYLDKQRAAVATQVTTIAA